jgi:predicted Fe-Mo cluster-binding NifX family protein
MKVAFAMNDENKITENYFGDAKFYEIYEISKSQEKFITRIMNTTKEEEIHADPKKAKGIASLFKGEGVQIVVSKVFGPNIKRIRKKLVCVLINKDTISDSIKTIQNNYNLIIMEWEKGEERSHLNFKFL